MTCSRPAASALAIAAVLLGGAIQAQAQTSLSPGQTIRASLDVADPQLPDQSHYDCYVVETQVGQSILVEQTSDLFDTFLLAGSGRDCEQLSTLRNDDAPGKGTNSALTIIGDGQPWFIIATSFEGGKTGTYVLTAAASATTAAQAAAALPGAAQPDFPEDGEMTVGQWRAPRAIAVGSARTSVLNFLSSQTDDGDFYNCYSFFAQAGDRVTITLDSGEFDALVAVSIGGDCSGLLLAEDDDSGGDLNARLVFTAPANSVYSYRAQALGDIVGRPEYRTSVMPDR